MLQTLTRQSITAILLACALSIIAGTPCLAYTPPVESGEWTEQSPATSPSERYFHAMAYVGDDKVLLFGGYTSGEGEGEEEIRPAETWVYDVSDDAWTLMNPSTQPPARAFHAMAHIGEDKALLFGGDVDDFVDDPLSDTWVYDLSSNTWSQKNPATHPDGRAFHAMAYAGWDHVLLFGGEPGMDIAEETWLYDLSADSWSEMDDELNEPPEPRYGHAMAYLGTAKDELEEDLAITLLAGGADDDGHSLPFEDDTWGYGNPTEGWGWWEGAGPTARAYHSMAYLQIGYVVLFGGLSNPNSPNGETWVFDVFADSVGWIQQSPVSSPSARTGAAMAHGGKGVAVLFGGDGTSEVLDDTWVFRPAGAIGITVTPVSGLITTESGGTATFEISADTEPSADVVIPLTSSDASEGAVPATVVLPANTTAPQIVTVTGLPDGVEDGDIEYAIATGDPVSLDEDYDVLEAYHVADVAVSNWDINASRIEVRGDGEIIANGDTTPSPTDDTHFGTTQIDTSVERTFEIRNQGDVDLELDGDPIVTLQGSSDFTVIDQPSRTRLDNTDTTEFTIRCRPSGTGTREAVVRIRSNDPDDDPFEFTIECSGGDAPIIVVWGNGRTIANGDDEPSVAKHTIFPLVGDAPITRTYTISNRGDRTLLLHNGPMYASVNDPQFAISEVPRPDIEPGETTTFDITFTRGAKSYVEATVTISSSDDDQDPYTFQIIGTVDGATEPVLRADAGEDQLVLVGTTVVLDGTGSRDAEQTSAQRAEPDMRPKAIVNYSWAFKIERYVANSPVWAFPTGSTCRLTASGLESSVASFVADKEGRYVLTLEVTNSIGETATDEVVVTAVYEFPEPDAFRFDSMLFAPVPFANTITFGFEGQGLADRVTVSVYDLQRQLVWTATDRDTSAITWNGRTLDGEQLANGPYIAVIQILGNGSLYTETRTIFILR